MIKLNRPPIAQKQTSASKSYAGEIAQVPTGVQYLLLLLGIYDAELLAHLVISKSRHKSPDSEASGLAKMLYSAAKKIGLWGRASADTGY